MTPKPTLKQKIRYMVDNTFAHGSGALITWLAILSLAIIAVIAFLVTTLHITPQGETPLTFWEAFWRSLMRTLDAGTMGADSGWFYRIAMLVVTIGGVFVISTLIGILSTAIGSKLEELRKGRSQVMESGHTIILGWTEQIFIIISELQIANENQRSSCIAILAEKDKVEMEDEINARLGQSKKTRIVCRTGSPTEPENLSIVSINEARSVIILSPHEGEVPDAEVLKIILAIVNHPSRKKEPYHIVAEMRKKRNADVASIVGKNEVELVLTGDIVARIIAQTCRQSGLSVVYTELLNFGGDEIYVKPFPEFNGIPYGDLLNKFEKNAVMGLVTADGQGVINPPMDQLFTNEDKLVVIAEDDDKIFADGNPEVDRESFTHPIGDIIGKEETLILGWNHKAKKIIEELDSYVPPGSTVIVLANTRDIKDEFDKLNAKMTHLQVDFRDGDITDRENLESTNLAQYEHIILLSYSDQYSVQQSDAQTMITLLHLRDIAEKKGLTYSIVSEMLDIRNRNLAEIAHADDFIVSDQMISLLLAQVSEREALNMVFKDIFDSESSEVYLKSAGDFIKTGIPVNFYTVVEAARARGETAIGYRIVREAKAAENAYGIHINPNKSEKVVFEENDRLILLAND